MENDKSSKDLGVMTEVKVLKIVIILQLIILPLISIILSVFEEELIPEMVLEWQEQAYVELYSSFPIQIFAGITLLSLVISAVGLFFVRRWARNFYAISYLLLGPIMYFLAPPEVITPIFGVMNYLTFILIGFTIGLIYYSPAKSKFE